MTEKNIGICVTCKEETADDYKIGDIIYISKEIFVRHKDSPGERVFKIIKSRILDMNERAVAASGFCGWFTFSRKRLGKMYFKTREETEKAAKEMGATVCVKGISDEEWKENE